MYGQLYLKLARIVPKIAYGPHFCYTSPQMVMEAAQWQTKEMERDRRSKQGKAGKELTPREKVGKKKVGT